MGMYFYAHPERGPEPRSGFAGKSSEEASGEETHPDRVGDWSGSGLWLCTKNRGTGCLCGCGATLTGGYARCAR